MEEYWLDSYGSRHRPVVLCCEQGKEISSYIKDSRLLKESHLKFYPQDFVRPTALSLHSLIFLYYRVSQQSPYTYTIKDENRLIRWIVSISDTGCNFRMKNRRGLSAHTNRLRHVHRDFWLTVYVTISHTKYSTIDMESAVHNSWFNPFYSEHGGTIFSRDITTFLPQCTVSLPRQQWLPCSMCPLPIVSLLPQ